MRYLFIFIFIISCKTLSVIDKEKKFLEQNPHATIDELNEFFGTADDSLSKDGLKLYIWDNLWGEKTMYFAPPYSPLDSSDSFGKRVLQVVVDTNGKMKEFDYWDYTNPEDFKERGLLK